MTIICSRDIEAKEHIKWYTNKKKCRAQQLGQITPHEEMVPSVHCSLHVTQKIRPLESDTSESSSMG